MAKSNKNYSLDSLSDELTLKILENLDGISDRSNVARVSTKLNRLTKDRHWRKSIFISEEEYEKFSENEQARVSCLDAIMKELTNSDCLESLTLEFPKSFNASKIGDSGSDQCSINNNHKELLSLIAGKFESVYAGICWIHTSNPYSHLIIFFSSKYKGSYFTRRLNYHPTNTTCILYTEERKNILIEEIVENCKETLQEFSYRMHLTEPLESKITLPLLRQLSKCKKLKNIVLGGHFDLSNNLSEAELPKIRSELVYLFVDPFIELIVPIGTSRIIADTFFSDAVHLLKISFSLLKGMEGELFSKCPNLRCLSIILRKEDIPSNEIFLDICNTLLRLLNDDLQLYELQIYPINSHMQTILLDYMRRILTVEHAHIMGIYEAHLIFTRPERNWTLPSALLKPHFYVKD